MMRRAMLLTALATTLLLPLAAHAFKPDPGNRAYPVEGADLVSGTRVSLDDYLGKWVLLELWSST